MWACPSYSGCDSETEFPLDGGCINGNAQNYGGPTGQDPLSNCEMSKFLTCRIPKFSILVTS